MSAFAAYAKIDKFLSNNLGSDDYAEYSEALSAVSNADLAARDAEWRAAVERVREQHPGVLAPAEYTVPEARVWARGAESALKSLLAAMVAP